MSGPIKNIMIPRKGYFSFSSEHDPHFDELAEHEQEALKKEFAKRKRIENKKKLDLKNIETLAIIDNLPEDLHVNIISNALNTPGKEYYEYISDIVTPNEIIDKYDDGINDLSKIIIHKLREYFNFLDKFIENFPDYISNYYELSLCQDLKDLVFEENVINRYGEDLRDIIYESINENEINNTIINLRGDLKISSEILYWIKKNNINTEFINVLDVNIGNIIMYTRQPTDYNIKKNYHCF